MKKIVHLIDNLIIGGAQTHLLTMMKCVDRSKYVHKVYSLTDDMAIGREIEKTGIETRSLDLKVPLQKKRWGLVTETVTKMLKDEKPDILETHLTWSRIFGTISSVKTGCRPMISFEQGDIFNNSLKYRIANFLASFFIDIFIVPSYVIKKWNIKNYGIPGRKIRVMPNSVLTDLFRPKEIGDYRETLGIGEDELVIGSVGTLGKGINKGINYCIEAVSLLTDRHKNIRLLIAGDGELRGELEKQTRDLGLEGIVKFLGFRRDIELFLNAIDIFILASIFEPFGIALVEAMSVQKPVIASDAGGIPEIIEDGVNGFLFPPRDPRALAVIIDKLAKDEKLRKELGVRARRSVEERFDARKYIRRLESLYDELLKDKT